MSANSHFTITLPSVPVPYSQEYFNHFLPLLIADSTRKSALVTDEAIKLVYKNVGIGLRDIETMLRATNSHAYLIARNRRECDKNNNFWLLTQKTYYLFVSTMDMAAEQVLTESSSYRENFKKLENAGVRVMHNESKGSGSLDEFIVAIGFENHY
jgi:hypothetical protein